MSAPPRPTTRERSPLSIVEDTSATLQTMSEPTTPAPGVISIQPLLGGSDERSMSVGSAIDEPFSRGGLQRFAEMEKEPGIEDGCDDLDRSVSPTKNVEKKPLPANDCFDGDPVTPRKQRAGPKRVVRVVEPKVDVLEQSGRALA